MQIIPHLPAPTALHEPSYGHAAHAGAQQPVGAFAGDRLRRDPALPQLGAPVDQGFEAARVSRRTDRATTGVREDGAASLFFAQQFAQEDLPHSGGAVIHERAVAAYPSLGFDGEIFLPGHAVPLDWTGGPRLDIRV